METQDRPTERVLLFGDASAHYYPKFVTVLAAMERELRKVGTGAVVICVGLAVNDFPRPARAVAAI